MGPGVSMSLHTRTLLNFADVTLADDDTNSILADDVNRAIWNQAMQVTSPDDQIWNQFGTNQKFFS